MKNSKVVSRRMFIRQMGLSGIALTIGAYGTVSATSTVDIINGQTAAKPGTELMAWISIDQSGRVTIMNHRSEMGQGT